MCMIRSDQETKKRIVQCNRNVVAQQDSFKQGNYRSRNDRDIKVHCIDHKNKGLTLDFQVCISTKEVSFMLAYQAYNHEVWGQGLP